MTNETVKFEFEGKSIELPVKTATTGEKSIDISRLRSETGYTVLDPGFGNTCSCESKITYVNGEKAYCCTAGCRSKRLRKR